MVGPSIHHSPICTMMKSKWKVSMREGWVKLLTYNIKLFLLKDPCMNAHSVSYVWISINTNTQRMPLVMCYLFQETRHDNLVRHTLDAGQKIPNKRSQSNAKTSNEQTYALKFIGINLAMRSKQMSEQCGWTAQCTTRRFHMFSTHFAMDQHISESCFLFRCYKAPL